MSRAMADTPKRRVRRQFTDEFKFFNDRRSQLLQTPVRRRSLRTRPTVDEPQDHAAETNDAKLGRGIALGDHLTFAIESSP
jgi:hypothetical protein